MARPPPRRGRGTVIVGNCGTLTGGIVLLPDAVIDDALLDLAVLTPESLTQWAALAGRVVTGQAADGPSIARSQGREVVIVADPPAAGGGSTAMCSKWPAASAPR
jgi:diacylglycerol kinase (ATP)